MTAEKRRTAGRHAWIAAVGVLGAVALAGLAWVYVFRPADPAVRWKSIEVAASAGRWDAVARHLRTWVADHPADRRAQLLLGGALGKLGRDAESAEVLGSIRVADAEWPRAQALLGELAFRQHDAAGAETAWRAVLAADPKNVEALRRLVYLLVLQQRGEEARSALESLYKLSHDVRDLVTIVSLAAVTPDARDLRPELDAYLAQAPDAPWLRRARGLILLTLGRPAEARDDLELAARTIDDDPLGRLALAECRLLLGEPAAATDALGSIPDRSDLAARWDIMRGRVAEAAGKPDDALAAYRSAVGRDDRNRDAHYRLGQVLLRQGPAGESEARTHLDRAEALRTNEALLKAELNDVLAGHRDVERFQRLAGHCRDAGLDGAARSWMEQALTADPTRAELQTALARLATTTPPPADPAPAIPHLRPTSASSPPTTAVASTPRPTDSSVSSVRFEDVARRAGLAFQYNPHASGNLFIGDTMGGGVGLIDFDADGWLDVYLVGGCKLPVDPAHPPSPNRLFRNNHDGKFQDVTSKAGAGGRGYGMGCAVGDYDGDGHDDLFVTGLGSTVLYRNNGDGTFADLTARAGVGSDRWTTAAGFADLDGDGDLDLVAITYVDADPARVPECRDQLGKPIHCPPGRFAPQLDHLFRNNGDGTFTDVSRAAGLDVDGGDGLGLAIADLDDDGKLDLFVANDAAPDFFFRNLGGLKFEEVGVTAGVAYDATGRATASMGVVADDLDGDGRLDLFHTNFNNEPNTFLRNLGGGQFADATAALGLEAPSRAMTGFGTTALDADADGTLDLFVANGHVDDQPWFHIPMAQRPQLYLGRRGRSFVEATGATGAYFRGVFVGRGAATGDLDNDGRVDLVVVHRDAPVALLRNTTVGSGHWASIALVDDRTGRLPVGARVSCRAGTLSRSRWVTSGTSYLSQNDTRLTFGLGPAATIDRLEVRWPSGKVQRWDNLPADRLYTIRECDGPAPPVGREAPAR